jgi:hypothetical protein
MVVVFREILTATNLRIKRVTQNRLILMNQIRQAFLRNHQKMIVTTYPIMTIRLYLRIFK